jgi:hypothetical protein
MTLELKKLEVKQGTTKVYNFSVEDYHTYFVTDLMIRTHNSTCLITVTIPKSRYPEYAQHVEDAQVAGHPAKLTLNRPGASDNRKESLKDVPVKPGYDRDEYPPAMFEEGGAGASVRYMTPSQKRGAGSYIKNQLRGKKDGTKVILIVGD